MTLKVIPTSTRILLPFLKEETITCNQALVLFDHTREFLIFWPHAQNLSTEKMKLGKISTAFRNLSLRQCMARILTDLY
jgi:hypothetical protein